MMLDCSLTGLDGHLLTVTLRWTVSDWLEKLKIVDCNFQQPMLIMNAVECCINVHLSVQLCLHMPRDFVGIVGRTQLHRVMSKETDHHCLLWRVDWRLCGDREMLRERRKWGRWNMGYMENRRLTQIQMMLAAEMSAAVDKRMQGRIVFHFELKIINFNRQNL